MNDVTTGELFDESLYAGAGNSPCQLIIRINVPQNRFPTESENVPSPDVTNSFVAT